MKKHFKKLVSLICVMAMALSLIPTVASAANVGDVVGYAQPTDIVATINGYQLESYNVNGYTYICVEDLRYYGFDVVFDYSTKTLGVTRNHLATQIDPQIANPNFWAIGSNKQKTNILYTDIVTYVNNNYVASSNINGKTIINFNELSAFGTVNYDNNRREISLSLNGVNSNLIAQLATIYQNEYPSTGWKCLARAKGSLLMLYFTSGTPLSQAAINSYINNTLPQDKQIYKNYLASCKNNGWPITSIYVECQNSDGSYVASFQVN